jgi:ankyrin repeat protein
MPDATRKARPPAAPRRLLKLLSALRPPGGRDKGLPDTLTGAASRGDLELVRVFLDRGASLEERSIGFASPLAAACAAGQAEVVEFLLARGAKVRPEQAVISPTHAALQHGHARIVQLLRAAGATVSDMERAFVDTCKNGRYSMIKLMLDAGLDIDRPGGGYQGETIRAHAIRGAQMSNHPRIAAYLRGKPVEEAALVAAEARAVKDEQAMAVGIMREGGREPVATGEERAAKLAEAEAIVRAAGPKAAKWANEEDEPVLNIAARSAVASVVEALLTAGADPNAAAPDSGLTPLIRAAEGGSAEIVRRLLARGADASGKTPGGRTAVQAAAEFGDPEVVRLLVEAGADPSVKPADGRKAAARIRGPYAPEIKALLEQAGRKGRRPSR